MWLYLALGSAFLLGLYDVAKKQAVSKNGVLNVLLLATALSTLLLSPCFFIYKGTLFEHLALMLKAVIVTTAWISGMVGLKLLPITTASMIKASRPFFVVLLSILIFGERLNWQQWTGVGLALLSLTLLSVGSRSESGSPSYSKGVTAMVVSVVAGVGSALYDKVIMSTLQLHPLFVQSWSNFYIVICLALCIAVRSLAGHREQAPLRWDWTLLLIAVLITAADMLYFVALRQEGALLSVISLLRRCAVIVTFAVGAIFFKEKKIKAKAFDLAILLAGMVFLLFGSR
ncbi:MAG: EamA family transporter [Candidatus Cryptobacteroides sp.]